jgi:4-hydroxy-3-polyprenylbenzoate decarboxylase
MGYQDLRDWLRCIEEMGELKRLTGAHWDREIGAITDVLHHTEPSPAVLFNEIVDYSPGQRILVNALHSRQRLALTMGLPPAQGDLEFVSHLREKLKSMSPIPPTKVESGPVSENVLTGKDIDVLQFPAPKHPGPR